MKDVMVSIIVPTYGHEKYIAEALNSILIQKTQYRYEVIVGEDASPDNTRDILHEYEEKYPDIFTMIYRDVNYGASANGKDLVRRASGKYIINLEGDDFWISEDKLERQVSYLEAHPQYVAVAHNCIVVDKDSVPIEEYYPECKDEKYTLRHFRRGILPGQTATVLYRAEPYQQISDDKIWSTNPAVGDRIIFLGMVSKGPIYCIQENMSAYRHVTSEGTSFSATVKLDFNKMIIWHKSLIDFSRRLGNQKAVIAAEGRYAAVIFFEGVLKREITLRQAYDMYQYIDYKFRVLIIKIWDFIARKTEKK